MDPSNPVRPVNDRSLTSVQRWVVATLVVFTVALLAIGIVIAALVIDPSFGAARVGLTIIAMAFGVLGLLGGFAVHGRGVSAWLLLGLIPGVVGLVLVLA